MATIHIRFRPSAAPGRPGTICYQLSHGGQSRLVASAVRLPAECWDAGGRHIVAGTDAGLARQRVEGDLAALRRIVRNLETSGNRFTVHDIVRAFRSPEHRRGVLEFFGEQIALLLACNRFGTARNYERTRNSFAAFLDGGDIPFEALSEELVAGYNAYLVRRGVVRNTVSFYMRILRSVYNKAVRQHLTGQAFPFRDVYTGVDRTRKRAVGEEVVARLCRLDLAADAQLALARDLFVFSYCARGMAFVDMAFLRRANLRQGVLCYTRRKTGQPMCVRMEPCMQAIVGRYADCGTRSEYLFPILREGDSATAYRHYQAALNAYNRLLKRLAELVELPHGLTSYTARHTWATAARNHAVPVSVISAGMGHTSERTTQIYLSALEDSVVDAANRGILAALGHF